MPGSHAAHGVDPRVSSDGVWKHRQPIPSVRALTSAIGLAAIFACAAGCAGPKPRLAPSTLPAGSAGALEVVLEIDVSADLDLHVSDPELETVYFGNSPSVNGGVLDRDVRCERAGEGDARRETVRFESPLPGRYRVGVDYVKACRRLRKGAHYEIRVRAPGLELVREGDVSPGHFEHKALEFDWAPPSE